MKSSTLHRSNLTKERMSMLENVKLQTKPSSEINQYVRVNRTPELDVLYRSLEKTVSASKTRVKTPGVYLGIGFLGGAVFLLVVALVVWFSSLPGKKVANPDIPKANANLEVISDTKDSTDTIRQEKYVIKSGDTLDKIAFRFYGKYDVNKIEEIKKINNISHPEGLQIGQVLIIPLDK